MNPFSIPSLISTILLGALGIILYLQNPRERINRIFSALMFFSTFTNASAFVFHLSTTEAAALGWTKIPYVFAIPSQILGVYYVLLLTGKDLHSKGKVLGLPASLHFKIVVVLNVVLIGLLVFTDKIIAGVEFNSTTGYEHTYGELFFLAGIYFMYVGALELTLMIGGYRKTDYWLDKRWLRYNIVGFLMIFFFGGLLALYLPLQGIPSHSFTFIPFTIAAFIFYYALLKHQIGQIQELNENLEQRVDERTRELRQAQAQLIQSEKMASLGQLVAGIAHEINNPLGSMKSNNDIIHRSFQKLKEIFSEPKLAEVLSGEPRLSKILKNADELSRLNKIASDRIGALVISLKHFARLDEAEYQKANLNECLDETLVLLHHQVKGRIEVIKNYGDIPQIVCMPRKLNQVFMNLLINAIQAISGNGTIIVTTYAENDRVVVKIKDTGMGIPPENLDKIFNPGFTTKGVGVGTGLGLPICYGIVVEEHGGKITVDSEVGQGTEFVVELKQRLDKEKSG
jgi:signal transduction histidine kinase